MTDCRRAAWFTVGALALFLGGCSAIPSGSERRSNADALASARAWAPFLVETNGFDLLGYAPLHTAQAETVWIYVEGDGLAWLDPSTPSADPTPRDPVALRMALEHQGFNAAYISRPCQYGGADRTPCSPLDWTDGRFSDKVIDAVDQAVSAIKRRFQARNVALVGYSGGGAVTALVAGRRSDVVSWVSVAGNLDHDAWTAFHRVKPLKTSLNAADLADRLQALPQVHFVGENDRVVPPLLARRWPAPFLGLEQAQLRVVGSVDHACCWAEMWPRLQRALPKVNRKEPD